jgi:hypothetical protein
VIHIRALLALTILLTWALIASIAYSDSGSAPGQTIAQEHCQTVIERQVGIEAGRGPNLGLMTPTNCDHNSHP